MACTSCKKGDAVYARPYSGERLCSKCFLSSIESKVRVTIAKYDMFEPQDRIAVAVSGGKDSVSLLDILFKIERAFPKAELFAITIDEGIKGYRDEALDVARAYSAKLGVKHIVASFKGLYGYELDEVVKMVERKGLDLGPCSYCGVLRRRALNVIAREEGTDKLATAHTLDDEAQTVMLNILHGDPIRLARTKPVTEDVHPKLIQRVKPLFEVPEREVALYAYLRGIKFQSVPCPYASRALRNDVRIALNRLEHNHPGVKYAIVRSAERMRPALEAMAKGWGLRECKSCGEPTAGDVCKPCQMLQELKVL